MTRVSGAPTASWPFQFGCVTAGLAVPIEWGADPGVMRLRVYDICAILAPLAVFAAVAAAGGDDGAAALGLGPGATVRWLYPRSAIRELVAYAAVATWLLWTRYHRAPAEFHQALWRAPLLLVLVHLLFPLAVLLANGEIRTVLSEQGGRILLRLLVRLLVGYAYVGLIEWARRQITPTEEREARP
jgi:hypothetical protein